MTQETNTNTDAANTVDGGGDFTPPSYDIAPEDTAIADEITSLDPLTLPSSHSIKGNPKFPKQITLQGLSPDLREQAEAHLKDVPAHRRADVERQAVERVIRDNVLDIRSRGGFASSVDTYWHEVATCARESSDCLKEFDQLSAELAAGVVYDKGPNGEPVARNTLSASAQRRIATRQAELLHKHSQLVAEGGGQGPETKRRLAKALFESVEKRKTDAAQLAVQREADALARKMAHDERVAAQAEGLLKKYRTV